MTPTFIAGLIGLLAMFLPGQIAANPQPKLTTMSVGNMEDFGRLKMLAERGNVEAQIKIGGISLQNHLCADALKWFSAAADHGSTEALFQKGHLLLMGVERAMPGQEVAANPTAGLRLIYQTATSGHAGAAWDMGLALKDGIGCPADPVIAYAWLTLCFDGGNQNARQLLNELALRLSTKEIQNALALTRQMKAGHWPEAPSSQATSSSPEVATKVVAIKLKFSGVLYSKKGNMVIINNRTMSEGETIRLVADNNEQVNVTCVRVEAQCVEIRVEGEAQTRILALPSANLLTANSR
jgi:TPR repeat protein